MNNDEVKIGQVFKDNDQPNRIVYPFITVLAVHADKALVKRTKDIDGAVAPRDVKTKISLSRLTSSAYSLVKAPAVLARELEASPA